MYDFRYRKLSESNIDVVTAFLPYFRSESDYYLTLNGDFDFAKKVWDFIDVLNTEGFVYGFDYVTWLSEAGQKYLQSKEQIADADILTIQKVLTSIVRLNRIDMSARGAVGIMKHMIDHGIILAILIRLEQIRQDMKCGRSA